MNKVIILGRLGQNPEVKFTQAGQSVANFSMATSERWTDKSGQKQERTEWHKVVVWGKLADICGQYLQKGHQCLVEGSLQTRTWEDKNGQKRYTTEVNAQKVEFAQSSARHDDDQGAGEYGQEYGSPDDVP